MSTTGKNLSRKELSVKELFIGKCWTYLDSNFSKFSQGNKIKIALELCKKNIPQVVEGQVNYTEMKRVVVEHKVLHLNIGEDIPEAVKERM